MTCLKFRNKTAYYSTKPRQSATSQYFVQMQSQGINIELFNRKVFLHFTSNAYDSERELLTAPRSQNTDQYFNASSRENLRKEFQNYLIEQSFIHVMSNAHN